MENNQGVSLKTFTNKQGKSVPYIVIQNGKYLFGIGFSKARAILKNAEAIKMILAQSGAESG